MCHGEGALETTAKAKCGHSSLVSKPWKAHSASEVQPSGNVSGRTYPPQAPYRRWNRPGEVLVRAFNSSTWEAEEGGALSSRPAPNVSTS